MKQFKKLAAALFLLAGSSLFGVTCSTAENFYSGTYHVVYTSDCKESGGLIPMLYYGNNNLYSSYSTFLAGNPDMSGASDLGAKKSQTVVSGVCDNTLTALPSAATSISSAGSGTYCGYFTTNYGKTLTAIQGDLNTAVPSWSNLSVPFVKTLSNSAPVITLPTGSTAKSDTANNIILLSSSVIADANEESQTVTLTITNGTVTLAKTTGLSFTTGDGTDDSSMVFSGTITNINNAIKYLKFTPTGGFTGTATVQIQTNDGDSGTDDKTMNIAVKGAGYNISIGDSDTTCPAASGGVITATSACSIKASEITTALANGDLEINTGGVDANITLSSDISWSANKLTLSVSRGYLLFDFDDNGAFKGSANITGTGAITINEEEYTVITALGSENSTTATDLQGMDGNLSGNYVLGADIDASATSSWTDSTWFSSIGKKVGDGGTSFSGKFNGLGHTVSGLKSVYGLFWKTVYTEITNIGAVNVNTVSSVANSGGLIGAFDGDGFLANSYTTGTVTSINWQVGGLIGIASQNSGEILHNRKIINSYSSANVTGADRVGGLIGYNKTYYWSGITPDWTGVKNCYATGRVEATNISNGGVGGLIGTDDGYNIVENSYATGNIVSNVGYAGGLIGAWWGGDSNMGIKNSYATGSVDGNISNSNGVWTGGFIGEFDGGSIENSYATGTVKGYYAVGGFVGYFNRATTIKSSYATGNVEAVTYVGGFIGELRGAGEVANTYSAGTVTRASGTDTNFGSFVGYGYGTPTVSNSYALGKVLYTGETAPTDKGFIGGTGSAVTASNNFFDNETSAQATDNTSSATAKTTAEMKAIATFSAWNIAGTGTVYPKLSMGTKNTIWFLNNIPNITSTATTDGKKDTAYSYTLTATDGDNDTLTWKTKSGTTLPSWLSINSSTGVLSGTPTAAGTYDVNITVSDGIDTSEQSFQIVVPANQAPTDISLSSNTLAENSAVGTTIGTLSATDPDTGDTATFTLCNDANTNDGNFTISGTDLKSNYSFDYETTTSQTVCVRVTDSGSATYDENLTVTITNVNEQPSLTQPSNITTFEDNSSIETITLSATDADGDSLTYTATSSNTDVATISISGNQLTIIPVSNSYGSVTITVNATDGNNSTSTKTFTVDLSSVNDTPTYTQTSTDLNQSLSEDFSSYALTISGISDLDKDDLNVSVDINDTSIVTITPTWSNNLSYANYNAQTLNLTISPVANKYGLVEGNVTINDGNTTVVRDFNISIASVNDIPTITSTPVTTATQDSSYSYTLTATDIDGDTITWNSVNIPSWLSLSNSILSGTPTNSSVGVNDVNLTLSDGTATVEHNFQITVSNINDAPSLTQPSNISTFEDNSSIEVIILSGTDGDGDALTYTATSSNTDIATVSVNGNQLTIIPVSNSYGSVTITVNATDGNNSTSTKTFTLNLSSVNDTPTYTQTSIDLNQSLSEDFTTYTLGISGITDVDKDDLNVSVDINDTSIVTITPTWSNNLSYANYNGQTLNLTISPVANKYGLVEGNVTINDGNTTIVRDFNISIASVNDAPLVLLDNNYTFNQWSVDLSGYSSDIEGDTLVYRADLNNSNLATLDLNNTLLTITPVSGNYGILGLELNVSDGNTTTTKDLNITILQPFTTKTGQSLSSNINSNLITLLNVPVGTAIRVDGGKYEINGDGNFSDENSSITVKDSNITLQLISSSAYSTTTTMTLYVGDVNTTFSVTTTSAPVVDNSGGGEVFVPTPTPEPEVPVVTEPIPTPEPEIPTTQPVVIIDDNGNFDEDPNDEDIDVIIIEDSEGEQNTEVINKTDTGDTLSGVVPIENDGDDRTKRFEVKLQSDGGEKTQTITFKTKEQISTTTETGVEIQSKNIVEEREVTTKVEINNNGTSITSFISKNPATGESKAAAVASFKTDAKTEIEEDGSIVVTAEDKDISEPNVNIEAKAIVKTDGTVEHTVVRKDDAGNELAITKAASKANNTVTAILDNGSVQTKAKQPKNDDGTVVITAVDGRSDGKAVQMITVEDGNGNKIFTKATVEILGAQSLIEEDGSVETKVTSKENVEASVKANIDGTAEHAVTITKEDGTPIVSKATSKVKGAQTVVKSSGDIETTAGEFADGDEYIIQAEVVTKSDGKTITRFVRVKKSDKSDKTVLSNTMKTDTPYVEGTESEIDTIESKLYIKTVAPLDENLVTE